MHKEGAYFDMVQKGRRRKKLLDDLKEGTILQEALDLSFDRLLMMIMMMMMI